MVLTKSIKKEYVRYLDEVRLRFFQAEMDFLRPLLMGKFPKLKQEQATEICTRYLQSIHTRPQLLNE